MWPFAKKLKYNETARTGPPIFLTNSLSGAKEVFLPLRPRRALLYTCGPTVYSPVHIGNLRSYVFSDTLSRVLDEAGYRVQRVINITDVGHLTSDGDEGEDKMEQGAKREKASATEISSRYTKRFLEDLEALNFDIATIEFPRATAYVREQIALAKTLEEKGFAYTTRDGLYFDTGKFAGYGRLAGVAEARMREGARIAANLDKRHPADFALWKRSSAGVAREQEWDSPWGRGFPGWHLECSAMARALLGSEIDIHTGGEDLAPIHHNNEIAQSEAVSGRPFARYWMHNAFLTSGGDKISKSLGNFVYLSDVSARGYHPLALRYFFLQAHYRTPLAFSWDTLESASQGLRRLWQLSREIALEARGRMAGSPEREHLIAAARDDLGTPAALGVLWAALRDEDLTAPEKWQLINTADVLFGLSLVSPPSLRSAALAPKDLPDPVRKLLAEREAARKGRDFAEADRLRNALRGSGYHVEDGPSGTILTKNE